MNWKSEWKPLLWIAGVFLFIYYLPVGIPRFDKAVFEALYLVKWYAREHVLLCLIPAFFIAGAIGVFISQSSVIAYLGAGANKVLAYGVASVSGAVLAVCSCTILPLFAGIYRMGAGIGPATAFLYSGPAINVLAIILTARVLGVQMGIARGVGAVFFSIIIGVLMAFFFRKDEEEKAQQMAALPREFPNRPLWKNALYFASLTGVLIFSSWGKPDGASGAWLWIYNAKWWLCSSFGVALGIMLVKWFYMAFWKLVLTAAVVLGCAVFFPKTPLIAFLAAIVGLSFFTSTDEGEASDWFASSWGFAKQIMPLLLIGVLVAGALLGRVGHEGLLPSEWVSRALGGNSLSANFFASFAGAFMYFATLTEVPILQGLLANGMGRGPALALLLAGPALSLPNMLVIRSVIGMKKTLVFVFLVIIMATMSGMIFGHFF